MSRSIWVWGKNRARYSKDFTGVVLISSILVTRFYCMLKEKQFLGAEPIFAKLFVLFRAIVKCIVAMGNPPRGSYPYPRKPCHA